MQRYHDNMIQTLVTQNQKDLKEEKERHLEEINKLTVRHMIFEGFCSGANIDTMK